MAEKKIVMSLDNIMGDRFGKYSKYIIQDRALPDVRDGLKPVQRRILYSMYKEGNNHTKPYRKSAKTVGNVIGNYHPHGDTSVYEAMVRLSQEWKMRSPLVDMQGNNGSIDNDPAAAMRYTEARLSPIASELLNDLDKDTVEMTLNFDDTEYEPTVLPAAFPNLLVNGATGISAGYATDIPPHNLEEVIDATCYRIHHPECTLKNLMKYMKGPDFPTGAIVEGKEGIYGAFKNGRGKVVVRSKTEIVEEKTMNKIIVTEIPYEVNKAELVRKIDEIRVSKVIDGIKEVRDESDRTGLRICIDLMKEVNASNILNYLFKNTDLAKNYNYNMVAIRDKRPVLMGIVDIIDGYIDHQIEVFTRKTVYDLKKAEDRKHILDGLIKAISILDEVVAIIRKSKDKADAKKNLIIAYDFTEKQAEAIVMLQLYRLTNTDILSLENEVSELDKNIKRYNEILESDEVLRNEIISSLKAIKKKYPMPRLTEIKEEVEKVTIDEKAMVLSETINVSVTRDGYIKRISNRSMQMSKGTPFGKKDDDWLLDIMQADTLDTLLCFTDKGNYISVPLHKVEECRWKDVGKHISYLVKIDASEKIIKTIVVKDFNAPVYVLLASQNGLIKRTALSDFEISRNNKPVKCMNLKNEDRLVAATLTNGHLGVLVVTRAGYCGMYSEQEVSVIGVKAAGVKSISLKEDLVASVQVFNPFEHKSLLLLCTHNSIKKVKIEDIPSSKRSTKGTTLYKNMKSRVFNVNETYVVDNKDVITMQTDANRLDEIVVKDYKNSSLETKPSSIKNLEDGESIHHTYIDQTLFSDMYDDVKIQDKEFEDTGNEYETLSLEDLLGEKF